MYVRKEGTFTVLQLENAPRRAEIHIKVVCTEDKDRDVIREIARKSAREIRRLTGKRVSYSVKTLKKVCKLGL